MHEWKLDSSFISMQAESHAGLKLSCNHELARLKAVYQYQLLGLTPDPVLDQLAQLAADLCQTSIALISFVGTDHQWFQSKVGTDLITVRRDLAFCNHTIRQTDVFVVPDTLRDPKFATYPLVTSSPHIRFYAGVPLLTSSGCALGTLCVMDDKPRELSDWQLQGLKTLSQQVMAQLELKRNTAKLQQMRTETQQLQQQLVARELLSQQDSLLFNLANQIRNSLDLDTILQTVVNEIHQLLQVDRCHFLWCLPREDQFSCAVTHEAKIAKLPSLIGEFAAQSGSIWIDTLLNLETLRIEDVAKTTALAPPDQEQLLRLGITAQLMLPLKTHSGQLGAIVCTHCHGFRRWSNNEVALLKAVADQVAIALDQAELFAQTRATALAAQTQAQHLSEALKKLQQTQSQLVQHEKMSSLGQLVAGVAHEINNPVNFIHGNIDYATHYVRDLLELLSLYEQHYPEPVAEIQTKTEEMDLDFLINDLPKLLSSMRMGADRIQQIVRSLRSFSRLDEAEMKPVNIHEGIDNTLLILNSRLKATGAGNGIRVIQEYGQLPLVECYAGQLNQVFMNVLSNAIDAVDGSLEPTITIRTERISESVPGTNEQSSGDSVVIRIQDNGIGITDAAKQKLFNPFFTTKPIGKGTGLGLSISYQIIVEKHGGILKCASEPGKGSEFWIQIPIEPPTPTT